MTAVARGSRGSAPSVVPASWTSKPCVRRYSAYICRSSDSVWTRSKEIGAVCSSKDAEICCEKRGIYLNRWRRRNLHHAVPLLRDVGEPEPEERRNRLCGAPSATQQTIHNVENESPRRGRRRQEMVERHDIGIDVCHGRVDEPIVR